MPTRTVSLVSSVMMVLLLCCSAPAADRLTLSSTNPTAFDMDQIIARKTGFFARENLDVDVTYMQPDLVIKALLAGTVDLAKSGTHFGMIAAARGGELKIIGGSLYGYPYQLISQPQFKSLADLKGQKIAGASLASITTTIFKDVMARAGIPPTAYTLLYVGGSPERFQAVSSGRVAASLAEAPPFNFKSLDAGRKALLNYADEIKNLQYTAYFASTKPVAQKRSLFSRFMKATGDAMRWMNDPANEKAVVEIMAQRLKIDEPTAARTYEYMVPENKAFRGEGAIDTAGLTEMIRLLANDQMIPKREPWEFFVDPAFNAPPK